MTVSFSEAMQDSPKLQLSGAMNLAQTTLTKVNDSQYKHDLIITDGNGTANVILNANDPAGNLAPITPTTELP